MKIVLIHIIIFFPILGLSAEKLEDSERHLKQAMEIELQKPQVAGGVVYPLEDGGSYFDHRIAIKVAREYFRVYQSDIKVESLIKALESDEVFVRDASFEVIKLLYPKKVEEMKIYSPFLGKKNRVQSIEKLKVLLENKTKSQPSQALPNN